MMKSQATSDKFIWLPLIVWIFGIFLVSSLSSNSLPIKAIIPIEYPLHIIAFFVLFLLSYRLFRSNHKKAALGGILLSSLIFTMIVSLSKECWQLLIPTRSFSLKDIFIDGGAAVLAMLAIGIKQYKS
jgi:VanZ family protein